MIEDIKDIVEQLTTKEKEFVNENSIDTPLKLIPLLLKRVSPQNVQVLASLIKKSVLLTSVKALQIRTINSKESLVLAL